MGSFFIIYIQKNGNFVSFFKKSIMYHHFKKTAKTALILVYLVIIAGAVVRMTGSGMGCPDWPKCFGHIIPPTDASELQWAPNTSFSEGQIIIWEETLQVANSTFTSKSIFEKENWSLYTKHDYANFNPTHTWIEYINRLFGAVAGLATFILALLSLKYWRKRKSITILSWFIVIAMGFQGWLGATVVYSVLEPIKITIHMVMALGIVALLIYLLFSIETNTSRNKYSKNISYLFVFALILTLIQIVLGTQVRQLVDEQVDIVGETAKNLWLQNETIWFYIHRSFSIIVTALNFYIAYLFLKMKFNFSKLKWILIFILLEIVTGMLMFYIDFPFGSQTLHLVIATLLFGLQFYMVLETLKSVKQHKTL